MNLKLPPIEKFILGVKELSIILDVSYALPTEDVIENLKKLINLGSLIEKLNIEIEYMVNIA